MIPSPSEHPRRPTSKDAGPILDTDDLAQATISSPSLGVIKERYAPAELTLQEVSLPDACRVINEVLAPDEDLPLEPNHLRRFLTRTALGDPLKCEELAELAPQFGDLIIRQIVTLSGADRKLIDRPSLEFSLEHPVSDGCAVTISPGKRPDTCELTLDWERELDYQSNYSLSERWEVIEEILLVAGEIDSASCKTRAIDPIGPRFQLEERATIEVVARDLASADPALDPHLSQRSDLLPLCALRLIDPEVESIYDLKERILHVHAQLSKISPNLPNEIDLDAAMVSRSQLEQLGDAPFIWNSSADMAIITVEHYVLVVTKASTGLTLLEDVQALEGYARRTRDGEIRPEIARLKSIQSASPSEEALAEIFKTFNLPSGWYFFGAMQAFVESDDHDARGRIKDGLLDAITSGNPATVELTRDYRIQGDDLDEFEDDSPAEMDDEEELEEEFEDDAEEEEGTEEDPSDHYPAEATPTPWLDPADRVSVTRSAFAVPSPSTSLGAKPAVGFMPADHDDIPELFSANAASIFMVSVSANRTKVPFLPVDIVQSSLGALGTDPDSLQVQAIVSDPTNGEREGYLTGAVKVLF